MGKIAPYRIGVLAALLAASALLIQDRTPPGGAAAKESLGRAFARVGPWQGSRDIVLEKRVLEELKLDDYLFRSFTRDRGEVTVYVGYYRSAGKIGAAHDPLVCFQGQGWQVGSRESGRYLPAEDRELSLSYSSMVAHQQDQRQLIVYWFQANGHSAAGTLSQKLAMFWERCRGRNGENAFVRISAPLEAERPEAVRRRIFEFIDAFYPHFHRFVTGREAVTASYREAPEAR